MRPARVTFSRTICFAAALGCAVAARADEVRPLYPRITVINFDPILTSEGGQRLHAYKGWSDPHTFVTDYLAGMQEGSHGLVTERVTRFLDMDFWPVKADGYQYTEADYLAGNWHSPDGVDYHAIARDYDLARRVDRGEIDEVKIHGAPYFGYWESTMAGRGGYWCNSSPQQRIASSKIFIMMGWNYERPDTILHATGHRAESIMTRVYGGWNTNGDRHLWDRFGHNVGQTTITSIYGIGSAHYPPNGDSDYDYANPQTVESYAPDWMNNFPDFTGDTALVNRNTWGSPYQYNFLKWWYRHMPHVAGRNQIDGYDRLNNWWEYIFAFNEHAESGGEHVAGGSPPPASPYPALPSAITSSSNDRWAPVVNASGRMVWHGSDGSDFEIYAANADGSGFVQITSDTLENEDPQINASGRVVWQAFDGQDYEIFTANSDGTGLVQITDNTENDWHPHISDTGRIVWDRWDGDDYEIFSANADGTDVVQITDNIASSGKPADDVWPRINASNRVVWFGHDGSDWEVYSANADGTGLTQLSSNSFDDEFPQISDAGNVAWHAWLTNTNTEIYCNQATGGALVRLTSNVRADWWPQLNSAGDVVWMQHDGSAWEIIKGSTAGGPVLPVTDNASHDQYPQIDEGGRIVWQGFDGNDWEIYSFENDVVLQITDNDYHDRWPHIAAGDYTAWHAESVTTASGDASNIFAVYFDGSFPPAAFDVEAETRVNTPVDITLEGSSSTGSPLDFIITTLPFPGTLVDPGAGEIASVPYTLIAGGRTVQYYPQGGYTGSDSFQFKVNDGQDSDEATATIHVRLSSIEFTTHTTPVDSSYASGLTSDGTYLYYVRRDSHELYRTSDGGQTWTALKSPTTDLGGYHGQWMSGMLACDPESGAAGMLVSRHQDSDGDGRNKVVTYDIATDTWSWTSTFTVATHGATVAGNDFYAVWHGGGSNFGGPIIRVDLTAPSEIIDERTSIAGLLSGQDPHWFSRAAQLATLQGRIYGIKNDWTTEPRGNGDRLYVFDPSFFSPSTWTGAGPEDFWDSAAWSGSTTPATDLGLLPFEPGYGSALVGVPPGWSWQIGAEGGLLIIAGRSPSDHEGWGDASDRYAIYDIESATWHPGSLPGVTGSGTSAAFHAGKVYIKRGGNPEGPYNTDLWVLEPVFYQPADFDDDRDVDLDDFEIFESCVSGPGIPYDPQNLPSLCTVIPDYSGVIPSDFDRDADVDQSDFAVFQRCYSGPDLPADPNCAD